jgi:hypothetical protein
VFPRGAWEQEQTPGQQPEQNPERRTKTPNDNKRTRKCSPTTAKLPFGGIARRLVGHNVNNKNNNDSWPGTKGPLATIMGL